LSLAAKKLNESLKRQIKHKRENKLLHYLPYAKQKEFHKFSSEYRERCFMAANQSGKTLAGAFEAAYHATGIYPEWWEGLRFPNKNIGWACGVSGKDIRDSVQLLLYGNITIPEEVGTGTIPKENLLNPIRGMGTPNLIDTINVKHKDGGTSQIKLKSYKEGRQQFQSATIDWIWYDEEPPYDIYTEGLTRTNNGYFGQLGFMTYTPLLGMSKVTHKFYEKPTKNQVMINMTLDDVGHYTKEEKEAIYLSYEEWERDARTRGIPILGSGRIYQLAEEMIQEEPLESIPNHWPQINGQDFGWDHPQSSINLAWDREADVIHVTKEFRQRECSPVIAWDAVRRWGDWIPFAWPSDGYQHDKSGKETASIYRGAGFKMLHEHATHEGGGVGVEAGITVIHDRMVSGRLKVNKYLSMFFEEFRMYHRKDGKVVKVRDDLMDALRYGIMMLRFAKTKPESMVKDLVFTSEWQ